MKKSLVVLGNGGHARVIGDVVERCNYSIAKFIEDDESFIDSSTKQEKLVNGLGATGSNITRIKLFEKYKSNGFNFETITHPSSIVSTKVDIGEGAQIFAGAVIQPGTVLGKNVIINTSATIDHDCKIADHVHIAPGAILCGGVEIGEGSFIGAGAIIKHGVKIGVNVTVGAGAVVLADVDNDQTFVGNPARKISL